MYDASARRVWISVTSLSNSSLQRFTESVCPPPIPSACRRSNMGLRAVSGNRDQAREVFQPSDAIWIILDRDPRRRVRFVEHRPMKLGGHAIRPLAITTDRSIGTCQVLLDDVSNREKLVMGQAKIRYSSAGLLPHVVPIGSPIPQRRPDIAQPLQTEQIGGNRDHDGITRQQRRPIEGAQRRPHVHEQVIRIGTPCRALGKFRHGAGHVQRAFVLGTAGLGPFLGQRSVRSG